MEARSVCQMFLFCRATQLKFHDNCFIANEDGCEQGIRWLIETFYGAYEPTNRTAATLTATAVCVCECACVYVFAIYDHNI